MFYKLPNEVAYKIYYNLGKDIMQLEILNSLEEISPREDIIRAGVIPFSYTPEGEEVWLMGILPSGRFSDFGGSCIVEQQEEFLDCLLREVDEESDGLISRDIVRSLEEGTNINIFRWRNSRRPNETSYLLFVQVDYLHLEDVGERFKGNPENVSINWYYRDELIKLRVADFNSSLAFFMRRFLRRG